MTATARDPSSVLLEQFLLGQLPPDEVEQLCVEYADDERLAALAERLGPATRSWKPSALRRLLPNRKPIRVSNA